MLFRLEPMKALEQSLALQAGFFSLVEDLGLELLGGGQGLALKLKLCFEGPGLVEGSALLLLCRLELGSLSLEGIFSF